MQQVAEVDRRFQSYNIEMCEVIGGDFWVPYELLDSVLQHTDRKGFEALKWGIDPINLYDEKLRNLASALGHAYLRVSGTWVNDVYFQNNDEVPEFTARKVSAGKIILPPRSIMFLAFE